MYNIGMCYGKLCEDIQAVLMFTEAREHFVKHKNARWVAMCDEDISTHLSHLGQYEDAQVHAFRALNFAELMDVAERRYFSNIAMAEALEGLGEYQAAQSHYQVARELITSDNNPDWEALIQIDEAIANTFDAMDQAEMATEIRARLEVLKESMSNPSTEKVTAPHE